MAISQHEGEMFGDVEIFVSSCMCNSSVLREGTEKIVENSVCSPTEGGFFVRTELTVSYVTKMCDVCSI